MGYFHCVLELIYLEITLIITPSIIEPASFGSWIVSGHVSWIVQEHWPAESPPPLPIAVATYFLADFPKNMKIIRNIQGSIIASARVWLSKVVLEPNTDPIDFGISKCFKSFVKACFTDDIESFSETFSERLDHAPRTLLPPPETIVGEGQGPE